MHIHTRQNQQSIVYCIYPDLSCNKPTVIIPEVIMFHTPRKAALFISVLSLLSVTTTGLYSVHAEEPAMIASHEHRESHTTSRETTTWSEKTSTSKKSTSHSLPSMYRMQESSPELFFFPGWRNPRSLILQRAMKILSRPAMEPWLLFRTRKENGDWLAWMALCP